VNGVIDTGYWHGAEVMNDGYLLCKPTVHITVIMLLMVHGQMNKNIGRFTM